MDENKEITWQSPEFEYNYKDIGWYWMTIIAAAILFLLAIWQKNPLFGIFIVIAEIMLIFWAKEQPKILNFIINKKGVGIGTRHFYEYDNIQGFHVHERSYNNELILKTKNKLHPYIFILVSKKDISAIKEFLKNHLPEIEYEESLTEALSRIIRL